jgi:hypothetical protein
MLGRRKSGPGQLFYAFDLEAGVAAIIKSAGSLRFSTSPEFAPSWLRTPPPPAGPRSIRNG